MALTLVQVYTNYNDLRGSTLLEGAIAQLLQGTTTSNYVYDPTSEGQDNGSGAFIKPRSVLSAEPGRWVRTGTTGGGGGVSAHGDLTGLGNNDHPQYTTDAEAAVIAAAAVTTHEAAADPHTAYIKADGTRPFTGDQSMGGNQLTSVGAPAVGTDAARLVDITDEIGDHEAEVDPHPDYILADGTRPFTGPQSMGGEKLTDVGAPTLGDDAARLQDIDDRRTDWGDLLLFTE